MEGGPLCFFHGAQCLPKLLLNLTRFAGASNGSFLRAAARAGEHTRDSSVHFFLSSFLPVLLLKFGELGPLGERWRSDAFLQGRGAARALLADANSPPETATLFLFMSVSFLQKIV